MCRLIESIKLQDGHLQHLDWHNKRVNEARFHLFGVKDVLDLTSLLAIPEDCSQGVYKCRILYAKQVESVEFQSYTPRVLRTLQLVEDNEIEYSFKYENRSALDRLLATKGQADDILIVKNGVVTDTSYSNIVFYDGKKWVTPDSFLLNGTQRQFLLSKGIIHAVRITPLDLKNFEFAKPINAMLDFDSTPNVTILL